MFKNILFATDFSIHSSAALVYAKAIARRYGSKIPAVHVISLASYQGGPAKFPGASPEGVKQAASAQMRETDLRLRDRAELLPPQLQGRGGFFAAKAPRFGAAGRRYLVHAAS